MTLSGSLDFLLAIVCLLIAVSGVRRRNDFLSTGFLWVSAAAMLGGFRLSGATDVIQGHELVSDIATGVGSFLIAIGILAAMFGPWANSRWIATFISVAGVTAVSTFGASPKLASANLILAMALLVALLILAVQAGRSGRWGSAMAGLGAIALLLFVGFGLQHVPLPEEGIKHVDLLHITLITCYTLIWLAVRGVTALAPLPDADQR